MKITVEIESVEELATLLAQRDTLRDRVKQLEATPLKFSLSDLARKVTGEAHSLTLDQKEKIRTLIETY